jgi:hypothetical protein
VAKVSSGPPIAKNPAPCSGTSWTISFVIVTRFKVSCSTPYNGDDVNTYNDGMISGGDKDLNNDL